jgi:tetratricopeptide (TPR) repeat protein
MTDVYLEKGDVKGAIGQIEEAIAGDPGNFQLRRGLGNIYEDAGDFVAAIKIYDAAVNEVLLEDSESEIGRGWDMRKRLQRISKELSKRLRGQWIWILGIRCVGNS